MSSSVSTQIAQRKLAELESAKASLCLRLKAIETEAFGIRKKLAEIDAKKEAYTDMVKSIEQSEETIEACESDVKGKFLKCVHTGEFISVSGYSKSAVQAVASLHLTKRPVSRFTEIDGEISRRQFVVFEFFSEELSKAFLLDNTKESRSPVDKVLLYHRIHEKPYSHQRWVKIPVRGGFLIKCTKDDNILYTEDGTVHTILESAMNEEQRKRSVWTYVD
jgi:hypothetical protein